MEKAHSCKVCNPGAVPIQMNLKKPRLLLAVYGTIEYDPRALRSATTLSEHYDVTVMSVASGRNYSNDRFKSVRVDLGFPRASKSLSLFWFWLRFIWTALLQRPELVLASNYYVCLPGLIAARVGGARCIYDTYELMIPTPGLELSLRGRFFHYLERLCVRQFDLVIAANAERASMMKDHYGLRRCPLVIRNIPTAVSSAGGERGQRTLDRYPVLKRRGRIRLVYEGDMSLSRGIDFFIDVMKEIRDRCELLLIGDGPDRGRIAQIIQESGLSEDVVLLGIVPHEELNEILARCAIGIVTYPETGLNNIYCAPNKIIEYPRAGLPVVTTGQPLLQSLLERYKIGAVCRRNAHTTTTEAARTILSVVDSLAAYRRNLQRFLNDHQWTDEAKKLLNAVGELAER